MHEIDLVPEGYRTQRRLARWLKQSAVALTAIVAANLFGFIHYNRLNSQVEADITALQSQQAISTRQRSELEQLRTRKVELERQWQLLTGLRSGSAVEKIFLTVDKALTTDDVWFLSWKFQRAGSPVKPDDNSVNTGYFIVVPAGESGKQQETWKIDTHMMIQGEALDHAALSGFVKRLISQPGIQGVRVLKSTLRRRNDTRLVDFSLAVTVVGGMSNS